MNKLLLFLVLPLIALSQSDSVFIFSKFGEFSDASSISSSRGENIYVSDAGSNKIYKFNSKGIQLSTYGGTGIGKNELNLPVSLDASNGLDVFICDYLNNRIVRLDNNLNFVSLFDFNYYNSSIENSKKIYNPKSVTSISTGELLLVCDAGNYKSIRIKEFTDINLYFVQSSDRIFEPVKIIKGRSLDVWILDKSANELVNFNNLGIFVKRVKVPGGLIPINIANIGQYIVTLFDGEIIFYDVDKGIYTAVYYFPKFFDLKDLVLLDKETIFILQKKEIFKFTIK